MNRSHVAAISFCFILSITIRLGAEATVGAYYYPWWGANQGAHTFDETVRAHTTPNTQLPTAGAEYNSRDANVISSHIDQSHLGNISMWSMSWWGPNSFEDRTIRNHILPHSRASELSYTIHYESTGRLGSFGSPDYSNLIPDFQHLANNVFNDPNYMRIDNRPVVVMYLSRVYFDDATGSQALADLRTAMQNQYGYDPYIIGDHLFGTVANFASGLDAITTFDVYGQVFGDGVANQSKIDQLSRIYSNAKTVADNAGVEFIPGLTPGYNDKAVRPGNEPAPRYLPGEEFGSVMQAMLDDAVLPATDSDINNLILVNSFNEWHEDTQIEASVIGPATNTDDTPSQMDLTQGNFYEGYGNRYLDILRNATQTATTPAEVRWGRGTADGLFVGNYTDLSNWNADDVSPEIPRIPGPGDRARVDRGGSNITFDTQVSANDFLFGVDEANQTYNFESGADVTLDSNLFASFNRGNVTFDVNDGAVVNIGGNFLVGQFDGNQSGQQFMNDEDITVTIAGTVISTGNTIIGGRYGESLATTSSDVDVLIDITTGTLRTSGISFAPNGDLATFLTPAKNNSLGIRLGYEGQLVIVGSNNISMINSLISEGLLFTESSVFSFDIVFDGNNTIVQIVLTGDYNRDGTVDLADYTLWRDGDLSADGNGDGVVDQSDYTLWSDNFNHSVSDSGESSASSVPEPNTALMLFAIVLLLVIQHAQEGRAFQLRAAKS